MRKFKIRRLKCTPRDAFDEKRALQLLIAANTKKTLSDHSNAENYFAYDQPCPVVKKIIDKKPKLEVAMN